MRTLSSLQLLAGACVFMISGCAYPHPGPSLPENALPVATGAGATPTSAPQTPPAKTKAVTKPATHAKSVTANQTADSAATVPKPKENVSAKSSMAAPKLLDSDPVAPASNQKRAGGASDAGSSFDNFEMVDADLNGKVAILRVGSETTANNLMAVFVGLKNKSTGRLEIEVQTIYKDKWGNALNQGSWIPISLGAHEETEYHSASISPDATDFLVRIRHATTP